MCVRIDGGSLFQHLGEYGGSGNNTPVWPDLARYRAKVKQPPPVAEKEYSYLNVAALRMPEDSSSDHDLD